MKQGAINRVTGYTGIKAYSPKKESKMKDED